MGIYLDFVYLLKLLRVLNVGQKHYVFTIVSNGAGAGSSRLLEKTEWRCVEIRGNAWNCVGMRWYARVCVGMRGCIRPAGSVGTVEGLHSLTTTIARIVHTRRWVGFFWHPPHSTREQFEHNSFRCFRQGIPQKH